jgi:hypothetical protein
MRSPCTSYVHYEILLRTNLGFGSKVLRCYGILLMTRVNGGG